MDLKILQKWVAEWVVKVYGQDILDNKHDRAARVLEESLELGQASGLTKEFAQQLLLRVYRRPVGEVKNEAAGVGVALLALGKAHAFNIDEVICDEMARLDKDENTEKFRLRYAQKIKDGIATPHERFDRYVKAL